MEARRGRLVGYIFVLLVALSHSLTLTMQTQDSYCFGAEVKKGYEIRVVYKLSGIDDNKVRVRVLK